MERAVGSHYETLGVAPGARSDEIRAAYVRLARRHHPDLQTDPAHRRRAERRMQELNRAWAVLGDQGRRRAYDRALGLHEGPPKRMWEPLEPDDPDEPDPRDLLDDTPIGTGGRLPRGLQLAPPLLVLAAVGGIAVGSVTAIPGLLALGIACGVMGGLLFLAAPFVAVTRSSRSGTDVPGH